MNSGLTAMGQDKNRTICTWMGQDIETLSREELIEALRYMTAAYHNEMTADKIHARAVGMAEMFRRGEKQSWAWLHSIRS